MKQKMTKYNYYHNIIQKTFEFIIPPRARVLYMGSDNGNHLAKLKPSKFLQVEKDYENTKLLGKYDYAILNGVLGKTNNIAGVLENIKDACTPSTRIIVYQHNYLWQWVLNLAENFGLKTKEGIHNWLSMADVSDYLSGSGFEVTRIFKRTIFPLELFGFGKIINLVFDLVPIFDFLKLDQYLIARPGPSICPLLTPSSLTVCITVRNEKDNIEPIVKSIPKITQVQEILFVEGHSTDGTREEIRRVIKKYPSKNIRVIGQPGKGQGDAIRIGYKKAKGDIIILYEGDGTSDPGDLAYFYDAAKTGRYEFIEGSRFVYPLTSKQMPLTKKLGNIFFAKWFSFVLGQRSTDVLSGIKVTLKRDYDLLFKRWGFLGFDDPFGDFELLYGSVRMGLKIGEIPMRYYPRTYGSSHTKIFTHGLYLLKMAAKGYWTFRHS